jgi:hypothetical protein
MLWVSLTKHIVLLAQRQTMLQKLDPVTRARVLAALLGLIILGFAMILLAWIGARVARRYRQRVIRRGPSTQSPQSTAADSRKKPPASELEAPDGLEEGS